MLNVGYDEDDDEGVSSRGGVVRHAGPHPGQTMSPPPRFATSRSSTLSGASSVVHLRRGFAIDPIRVRRGEGIVRVRSRELLLPGRRAVVGGRCRRRDGRGGGQGGERDERMARRGRRYSYREEGTVREDGTVNRNDVDGSMDTEEEEMKAVDCPPPT